MSPSDQVAGSWMSAMAAWRTSADIRMAGVAARTRYPGPVGELLAAELASFGANGGRLDQGGLLARLARDLVAPGADGVRPDHADPGGPS